MCVPFHELPICPGCSQLICTSSSFRRQFRWSCHKIENMLLWDLKCWLSQDLLPPSWCCSAHQRASDSSATWNTTQRRWRPAGSTSTHSSTQISFIIKVMSFYWCIWWYNLWCFRESKISSSEKMRIGGTSEMAWMQICEPTDREKGQYTIEIHDGKTAHTRSFDLSGQGNSLWDEKYTS